MSNSSLPSTVLTGNNPTVYDKANPILIFIIQAVIVIIFCRILHFPLQRLRQPRVIAEVIGGILLGPTAFGRIPNFSSTIFPTASMPSFNLVANIGLILFLFIVGVEIDTRLVRKNARVAVSVGAASLAVPFGFGCLLAWALHKQYASQLRQDNFGVFLLFIGTAFSITAFPVLARILTELKLLRQDVGVTVLAAGVGNDVVGWILLALTVALVNSSSGLTAFYVILLVIAWTLLLFFAVKPVYLWLIRRSSSDSGPSDTMMMLTILLVLVSAFFTEIIGVHPIFGAFLVGLLIPHENGYAVSLTEKIEDLVSVLFLPLYFASSGLKTNIGLLNDGKAWGYTIAIIICATFSKVSGSMLMARANGFLWRESLAIGTLMSCKGLVELIVLNVGLSAGILDTKLFTMFVVMALVTTFMTTPLTMWIFPPAYQQRVNKWRSGECDWEGNQLSQAADNDSEVAGDKLNKVTVVVNKIEGVSPLLRFTHFLSGSSISLHLLRIMEMTDRLSQIIKVSESDDLLQQDSLVSIFKTMTRIIGVKLSYSLQVLAPFENADVIETQARKHHTDLTVLPWVGGTEGEWQDNEHISSLLTRQSINLAILLSHEESEMPRGLLRRGRTLSMGSILSRSKSDAEQINEKVGKSPRATIEAEKIHVFLPVFKFGDDEKLALVLINRLLQSDGVSASIVFFKYSVEERTSSKIQSLAGGGGSKVQFVVAEQGLSQTITASSSSELDELGAAAVPNQAAELAELEAQIRPHPNLKFEVIFAAAPVKAALNHTTLLVRQHTSCTLTTILSRSIDELTRRQVRSIDRQLLTSNYVSSESARGELVEVFAAHRERCGPIIVLQAKRDDL